MQGLSMLKKRRRKRRKDWRWECQAGLIISGTDVKYHSKFERRRLRLRPELQHNCNAEYMSVLVSGCT